MPRLSALVALLVSLPSLVVVQGPAASSSVCDGSELRRAERTRDIGSTLMLATAAVDLTALLTIPRTPDGARAASSHFALIAASVPVGLTGWLISHRASPSESFWERAVARMKVGETRAADVQLCLHRPDASSSNLREQWWTYVTARPLTGGGTLRALRLTFRDSVLADVERTEVNHYAESAHRDDPFGTRSDRRRGYCAPPVPVVADPFPTPTDTTAAAAMARAQADADAASKNAQLQAAYATCMASDSAQ